MFQGSYTVLPDSYTMCFLIRVHLTHTLYFHVSSLCFLLTVCFSLCVSYRAFLPMVSHHVFLTVFLAVLSVLIVYFSPCVSS